MKHYIIKESGWEPIEKAETSEYKGKIPIEEAIMESGFSPDDWERLGIPAKSISRSNIISACKKIGKWKMMNTKLQAN